MLPSFVKGLRSKRAVGKGKPVMVPDKFCPVCNTVSGSAPMETPFKGELCPRCQDKLASGMVAFVCGNEYAFGVPVGSLKAGDVMSVSPHVMEEVRKRFKQCNTTNDSPSS